MHQPTGSNLKIPEMIDVEVTCDQIATTCVTADVDLVVRSPYVEFQSSLIAAAFLSIVISDRCLLLFASSVCVCVCGCRD